MGCFDSFYNKEDMEIQVKTYDIISGGLLNSYYIGDEVPTACLGYDDKIAQRYGKNYNIFPYSLEDYIIIIRNGVFIDAVHYLELKESDTLGVKCYDKYGALLSNLKSPSDYITLKKEFSK